MKVKPWTSMSELVNPHQLNLQKAKNLKRVQIRKPHRQRWSMSVYHYHCSSFVWHTKRLEGKLLFAWTVNFQARQLHASTCNSVIILFLFSQSFLVYKQRWHISVTFCWSILEMFAGEIACNWTKQTCKLTWGHSSYTVVILSYCLRTLSLCFSISS